MKKLLALILTFGLLINATNLIAQDDVDANSPDTNTTEAVDSNDMDGDTSDAAPVEEEAPAEEEMAEEAAPMDSESGEEDQTLSHDVLKKYFIQGDPKFMSFVLICLILGLGFAIERIISLNLATTNVNQLLADIESKVASGDVEGAKEICKSTRGPVASIFYQGLDRVHEGVEIVEKSIIAYGSVQMGLLEKGLVWISLFISLAPMLGFMGTVIGMILAFDQIESMGTISASAVAGGIKVALLTTVFGLIVAIILQIFYNYIVSKIDDMVNTMEDASISFVDILVKHNAVKNN